MSSVHQLRPLVWPSCLTVALRISNPTNRLRKCKHDLTGDYAIYQRHDKKYRPFTLFAFAQPVPAYIGLLGSLLVVLVFTSSTWWIGQVTFSKIAVAYAAVSPIFSYTPALRNYVLLTACSPLYCCQCGWLLKPLINVGGYQLVMISASCPERCGICNGLNLSKEPSPRKHRSEC